MEFTDEKGSGVHQIKHTKGVKPEMKLLPPTYFLGEKLLPFTSTSSFSIWFFVTLFSFNKLISD